MATFEIPNNLGEIRQVNRGDRFGEIWASKGLDLTSSPGKVKVSKKLKRFIKDQDAVNTPYLYEGTARALLVFTNLDLAGTAKHYYIATDKSLYRCSIDNDPRVLANWEIIVGSINDFSDTTDAVVFDGQVRIARGTDIARFNGDSTYADNWWTSAISGTALSGSKPHTLHVHRGGAETILVTDGNLVRYYNAAAGHTTLTLADSLVANTLASGVDTIWVGTYAESSDDAYVYEFNIGNTLPNAAYRIDGQAVMAMDTVDNVPYILTDRGHIQTFNGSGFVTVASFPFAMQSKVLNAIQPGIYSYSSPPVFPKGMRAKNRLLYINIAADRYNALEPIDERTPSGVWEYNIDTGVLAHRFSLADEATDYGFVRFNEAGPILLPENDTVTILVGGGTALDGVYADSTEIQQGYLITPEYYGDSITQSWEKMHVVAALNGGSIEVKYRTSKRDPVYLLDVIWLNDTTFRTTSSLADVQVGDEIEIISGYRGGYHAHITALGTDTVTIDLSVGVRDEISSVRVQGWTRIPQDNNTTALYDSYGINQVSPWIQFKCIFTGDVEVQRIITKGNAKHIV